MSGYDALVRDLRRWAAAHPALTKLPVCPACGLQRQPSAFVGSICQLCEAERAGDYAARRLEELNPDGTPRMPPVRDEIVDDGFDFEEGR